MATSHRLPKRTGPSTAEPGGVRAESADLHSSAIPLAVAASDGREPSTLSSFAIQKLLAAGGTDTSDAGAREFAKAWAADVACASARSASFCSGDSILPEKSIASLAAVSRAAAAW